MVQSGEVIIVGSGPGGLAAAMLLAHRGFQVNVFEKEETIGGRSAAIQLGDYTFDSGPTFLMMNFIMKEVFQKTGRNVEDYLTMVDLEPMYSLQFESKEIMSSSNKTNMGKEVNTKFPGSGLPTIYQSAMISADLITQDLAEKVPVDTVGHGKETVST